MYLVYVTLYRQHALSQHLGHVVNRLRLYVLYLSKRLCVLEDQLYGVLLLILFILTRFQV